RLPVQRYDVVDDKGVFIERYWQAENKPVFSADSEVAFILQTTEELTAQIKGKEREFHLKQINKASEDKYRGLFDSIEQGFCTITIKYDEEDKPLDYQFIEVSPSFEQQTGIIDAAGKWMRDIAADQDEFWFETYGRIAKDRKSERFEYFSTPLNRWWSVYAFPIEEPELRRIGVLFNDITEQIKAKKKVEESEKQFRNVLLQSPNIFVNLEGFPEMIITFANEPLLKSWGRTAEIIGKPFLEAMPELREQPFPTLLQRVFETGETYYSGEEKAVLIKNGVPVDTYYVYVYQAIVDDNLKVTGVTIMATDITEQVTNRKRIEESEKRFSNLLMESPFAFAILKGEDMVIALANDAIKRIWGKGTEIEGKPLLSLMPEVKEQGFGVLLDKVYTTGQPFYGHEELVRLQRNGAWEDVYFNFIYQAYKEADASISGVTIIANEVTTQAIANKKIAASEENVRRLFMQAPAIIAVLRGPQHVFELSNKVHRELIGNRDLLGKTIKEAFPELEGTGIYELFDRVYSTGEPFIGNEIPMNINIGDGKLKECFFNFVYQPIHDSEGQIDGTLVHGIEVTEQVLSRKRLEESKEQEAYLLKLSDGLRDLTDPLEIQRVACRILGEQLQASRVVYGDVVKEERVIISNNYVNGVAPIIVTLNPEEFGLDFIATYKQNKKFLISDVRTDARFTSVEKQKFASLEVVAHASMGLIKGGFWVTIFGVHQNVPRIWTDSEMFMLEETAERTWAAVERTKAEQSLRKSEEKYRTLFNSIDEGFSTVEVLFDEKGKANDYIFLEMNPAHEALTGIPLSSIGKRGRDVLHLEDSLFEILEKIVLTGEPVRYELHMSALGKWYDIYTTRVGDTGSRVVATIFNNITERKNEEQRKEYLLRLSDCLKVLTDPIQIQETACKVLGEHVKASRVLYCDVVDEKRVAISANYVNGVQPITAILNAEEFGLDLIAAYKRNEKVIFTDASAESLF
ncbi:MAG TPA: PAS domain-containing protein, partial [Chitinophagaceae bacterium]|nr:PAS domain-containing protein [Chitinophagaceae bacterium]